MVVSAFQNRMQGNASFFLMKALFEMALVKHHVHTKNIFLNIVNKKYLLILLIKIAETYKLRNRVTFIF